MSLSISHAFTTLYYIIRADAKLPIQQLPGMLLVPDIYSAMKNQDGVVAWIFSNEAAQILFFVDEV